MTQRLMRRRSVKSKKVRPMSSEASELAVGKKLSERMWVEDLQLDAIDVKSPELEAVRLKASKSFGGDCALHSAKCMATTGSGTTVLVGLSKGDTLIGVYELSTEMNGVLFKRVCDRPVRDLLTAALLPEGWPRKYSPPNSYGGNRKLPSSTSVKDILSAQ